MAFVRNLKTEHPQRLLPIIIDVIRLKIVDFTCYDTIDSPAASYWRA